MNDEMKPQAVTVEPPAPVRKISSEQLQNLGQSLNSLFTQYAGDRRLTELKWTRNLRQYLGIYDPEIEKELAAGRSRAYPRITRIKCISVLSRIMNLMFPGNERNWQLAASPSPDMKPEDVKQAVTDAIARYGKEGVQPEVTMEFVDAAVQTLADKRAEKLSLIIDDQLQELGGDQTLDYVSLNRKVAQSGIWYGLGLLQGPFLRAETRTGWAAGPDGEFAPYTRELRKPQYEFLSVWDYYPDMSAKSLDSGDGYFIRKVLSRSQLRKLADRPDFMADQIRKYIARNTQGNYSPKEFETELRALGTKAQVNDVKRDPQGKYEVIVWNGPVSATQLEQVGVDIPEDAKADDVEAEVWMVEGHVIKADINPWRKLGVEVKTIHAFMFDDDDTSPVGNGLPNVVRDSQMSICAATRMLLDNASITCGPQLEINEELLRSDQDKEAIEPYKIWYREGSGVDAQYPAVRAIAIDSHLVELQKIVEMFMAFADAETFVGPATGGDIAQAPSEPMRTAAGASMLRSDAALPFKDIVRNFDLFTQSVILSIVQFNRKFNPGMTPEGDFNVIARGATSLIAKEVRGMQLDQLAATITPEERIHVDERKFVEARFAVRDMSAMLVTAEEALMRKSQQSQQAQEMQEQQREMVAGELRKVLAEAFKNITQGQKNQAAADAQTANAALSILKQGLEDGGTQGSDKPKARAAA